MNWRLIFFFKDLSVLLQNVSVFRETNDGYSVSGIFLAVRIQFSYLILSAGDNYIKKWERLFAEFANFSQSNLSEKAQRFVIPKILLESFAKFKGLFFISTKCTFYSPYRSAQRIDIVDIVILIIIVITKKRNKKINKNYNRIHIFLEIVVLFT